MFIFLFLSVVARIDVSCNHFVSNDAIYSAKEVKANYIGEFDNNYVISLNRENLLLKSQEQKNNSFNANFTKIQKQLNVFLPASVKNFRNGDFNSKCDLISLNLKNVIYAQAP